MDANGTRFHLFLGRDDWATCSGVTMDKITKKEKTQLLSEV
jgi:hypothetical protein